MLSLHLRSRWERDIVYPRQSKFCADNGMNCCEAAIFASQCGATEWFPMDFWIFAHCWISQVPWIVFFMDFFVLWNVVVSNPQVPWKEWAFSCRVHWPQETLLENDVSSNRHDFFHCELLFHWVFWPWNCGHGLYCFDVPWQEVDGQAKSWCRLSRKLILTGYIYSPFALRSPSNKL